MTANLSGDLSDLKTSGQSVNNLLSLLLISNGDGVKEAGTISDLELGDTTSRRGLLDGGGTDVLAASELEELLNVGNFLL